MANNPYGIYSGVVNNGTFQSAAPSYLSPVTMAMLGMNTSGAGNGQQYNTGSGQWETPTGVNANITGARVGPPGQTDYSSPANPGQPTGTLGNGTGNLPFGPQNPNPQKNGGDYDPVLNPNGQRNYMTKPMQVSGGSGNMWDQNGQPLDDMVLRMNKYGQEIDANGNLKQNGQNGQPPMFGMGGAGSGGLTGLAGASPQLMQQLQQFMASFNGGGQNPASRTNSQFYQPGQNQMGDVQPVGMAQLYSAPDMSSTGGLNGLSTSMGNNSSTGQSPFDLRGIFGRQQSQSYGSRGTDPNSTMY